MGRNKKKGTVEPKPGLPVSSKTLFVQNLPFTVSNETLLDIFKAHGPINNCFVVNDIISKKSRGIGYVKFADSDDATKALHTVKTIEGRKVSLSYANSKKRADETKAPAKPIAAAHKLIIRNIPFASDEKGLKELFTTFGEVTDTEIVTGPNGKRKGYGFISFTEKDSGEKAISSLNDKQFEGRKLSVGWFLTPGEYNKQTSGSKSASNPAKSKSKTGHKLIIRNLPFQMTEETLKKSLSKYGQVDKIDIPSTAGGKKRGFSFVTFSSKESAEKVLSDLKELNKRPVAVDWAVDKSTYISKLSESAANNTDVQTAPQDSNKTAPQDSNKTTKSNQASSQTRSKLDNKISSKMEIDDESGSEDDLDNESGSEDDLDGKSRSEDDVNNDFESDEDVQSDSDDELNDDLSSEEDDSDEEATNKHKRKGTKSNQAHKTSSADITQDRTLFLRNVGYETTEEQLRDVFAQFGDVSYIKLLVDAMTERSKGMAFVQYKKKQHADKCLEATQDEQQRSVFVVDGRELSVALAVSREKIKELSKAKEKQPKDKRNLYLAREGLIRQGTQAAEGVSKTDMNKRVKLETMMRAKLKNPLIFISPTRVCVHNLPTKLTDKQLKVLCLKAASQDKTAKITECRVIRDMANVNSDGIAKSRGFAFVEFTEHQHAQSALRHLNNNPEIFTNEKRPIVEFSLENTTALQAKERRFQSTKSALTGNTKNAVKGGKVKLPTKGSDIQVERPKGVKPGLPSHHGPKIRHKPRPSDSVDPKKEARLLKKRKEKEMNRREKEENKQPKPKKKRLDAPDSFDKLVRSYRNKMSAGVNAQAKSKWFD